MLEEIDIANPKTKNEYLDYYKRIRARTEELAEPLEKEDYVIQAVTDSSPTKWHLAHVSWFYEAFILKAFDGGYKPLNEIYNYIFNSYYQDVGNPFPRPKRGTLSRPTVSEVYEFRKYINDSMLNVLENVMDNETLRTLTVLGGNHEQQHQELMMTDLKHNFGSNPMFPAYKRTKTLDTKDTEPVPNMTFIPFKAGVVEIGHQESGFAFDNELPANKTYLNEYRLANRLVTNGEYLKFIEADGYTDFRYWLSDGWDVIRRDEWQAPLHWHKIDGEWHIFTLSGMKKLNLNEPVAHVSYFEADAYAKFVGKRLPSEGEWENAANISGVRSTDGNFFESGYLHPKAVDIGRANEGKEVLQMYGDAWEWTGSAYLPYPGFSVLAEGVSEYNGKFMNAQWVLKGGSCVTPIDHFRASYRNFFQSDKQWQFTGIRLAE